MKNVLNEKGSILLNFKKVFLTMTLNEEDKKAMLKPYNIKGELLTKLIDTKVSVDEFIELLKSNKDYILSFEELTINNANEVFSKYKSALEDKIDTNFTLLREDKRVDGELHTVLEIIKYIPLRQNYYKNFMGIDLGYIRDIEKNMSKYEKELDTYKTFASNRLTRVVSDIIYDFYSEKFVPEYKTKQIKPVTIGVSSGNTFNVKGVSLKVDLALKGDFNKNIDLMISFINKVETKIEKYMNYTIYIE